MNCDHGRETVVRTGEATSLGRKADRIALTGEVRGFPRLNQRPYGRGHGTQEYGDSGGDGRGVSKQKRDEPLSANLAVKANFASA